MSNPPPDEPGTPAHKTPPNKLINETSPYLLQHAHNPVHWQPWGPEAFAEARERDVPIFLSIGYSTCYWCHVMERESFEHQPTADVLNAGFVCIKVDREERPDIDDLYMAATVTMTGRGGWPMSVFLEPDKLRPFYCGTYFPVEPRQGMPSFRDVLHGMSDAWATRRDEVLAQADRLSEAVIEQLADQPVSVPVGEAQVSLAVQILLKVFDPTNGGFGGAPKFPQPVFAQLLLDLRDAADDATRAAIDLALRTTLDSMMAGGIHDHLGGGFHRYAVDETWTVPHFEKMLYDNAQLLALYARASVVYADPMYARTARRTAAYVLREMVGPGEPGSAGFFSAQDAEVNTREGESFLWTPEQIGAVLNADDAAFAVAVFGLDRGANFQDPHHPADPPTNVLRFDGRPEQTATRLGMDLGDFIAQLDRVCDQMLESRATRDQPGLDDKVLTAWNGMMIEAMAQAADWLGEPSYAEAAAHAARYLLEHHRDEAGTLLRSSRGVEGAGEGVVGGRAHTPAFLEDHAALAAGLLALHRCEAVRHNGHLAEAGQIVAAAFEAFGDEAGAENGAENGGGLFDTRADQADLFVRSRSSHDGAMPCGQSVMLRTLVGLAESIPEAPGEAVAARASGLLASMSPAIAANPQSTSNSVRALARMLADRARYEPSYTFAADDAASEPSAEPTVSPVEVYASAERVVVTEDEPGEFVVVLRIAPGYHIIAAEPGPIAGEMPGLVPLRIGLVSGQGVAVYADYPAPDGEPYGVEGVGKINVHHGQAVGEEGGFEIRVAIEKADGVGASPGRPILGITFQACTETECLAPMTLELDVAIDLN
ncbi:MAG: hypothetical protein ACI89L_002217 [Phycisphaerales bacterium]|jgi:uncharacterized protein YyaL (SSP411 family)